MASQSDGGWHRVAEPGDLADGTVTMARVGSTLIALSLVGGRYGALENVCPHAGGPLAQGMIEEGRLVCPWHGREFDPVTGECEGYAESARAFPVEARDDGVYVRVE